MKNLETVLDVLADDLLRARGEAEALQRRLTAATGPLLQLQSLAEALADEPEVKAISGERFTDEFVPAVLSVIGRLKTRD